MPFRYECKISFDIWKWEWWSSKLKKAENEHNTSQMIHNHPNPVVLGRWNIILLLREWWFWCSSNISFLVYEFIFVFTAAKFILNELMLLIFCALKRNTNMLCSLIVSSNIYPDSIKQLVFLEFWVLFMIYLKK